MRTESYEANHISLQNITIRLPCSSLECRLATKNEKSTMKKMYKIIFYRKESYDANHISLQSIIIRKPAWRPCSSLECRLATKRKKIHKAWITKNHQSKCPKLHATYCYMRNEIAKPTHVSLTALLSFGILRNKNENQLKKRNETFITLKNCFDKYMPSLSSGLNG